MLMLELIYGLQAQYAGRVTSDGHWWKRVASSTAPFSELPIEPSIGHAIK